MAMGIVICMAVVFAVHSKCSYPQCSNFAQTPGGVCVQNGYKKKQCSKNGCTNKAVRKGVCKNHGAKQYCTEIDCGKALFWTGKCRHHFRFSLAASTIDMCPVGLHATIMDITDLTLEVIQQYVGMNNWENVIAFAGVCKSRSVYQNLSCEDWSRANGGRWWEKIECYWIFELCGSGEV
jgi:hypothetical protein